MYIKLLDKETCQRIGAILYPETSKEEQLECLPDDVFGKKYKAMISNPSGLYVIKNKYASLLIPPYFVYEVSNAENPDEQDQTKSENQNNEDDTLITTENYMNRVKFIDNKMFFIHSSKTDDKKYRITSIRMCDDEVYFLNETTCYDNLSFLIAQLNHIKDFKGSIEDIYGAGAFDKDSFNWSEFGCKIYEGFLEAINTPNYDFTSKYSDFIGKIRVGKICVDIVNHPECNKVFLDLYVADKDTGYGYRKYIDCDGYEAELCYDYALCIPLPYSYLTENTSYKEFKKMVEMMLVKAFYDGTPYESCGDIEYNLWTEANEPLKEW